jgi:hypothetical protein
VRAAQQLGEQDLFGTLAAPAPVLDPLHSRTSFEKDPAKFIGNAVGTVGTIAIRAAEAGRGSKLLPLLRDTRAARLPDVPSVPGRVQSRIKLMNGSQAEKAGWNHVIADHFNLTKPGKSQFSISQSELRDILQSRETISSPVIQILTSARGPRYVREVTLGHNLI